MTDDKREAVAALEHQQWQHWTRYMLEVLRPVIDAGLSIPRTDERLLAMGHARGRKMSPLWRAVEDALKRWHRQINTPYADLTEKEKDSDRVWADKVLEITGTEDLAQHEITQFLRYLQACGGHDEPFDLKAHLPRIQSLLDAHDKPGPTTTEPVSGSKTEVKSEQ